MTAPVAWSGAGAPLSPGPGPGTSVFTYDVELEPHGVPRLAQPVLGWWLTHSLRRDLDRLRTMIETA